MGSATDLSLREGNTSTLVIKSWDAGSLEGAKTFLVGVDGSLRSMEALLFTMRIAKRGRDKIRVLYIEDLAGGGVAGERDGDAVEASLSANLKTACHPEGLFDFAFHRSPRGSRSPAQVFVDEAEACDASVVVVGADGIGATLEEKKVGLGSISDAVLRAVRTNVLIFYKPLNAYAKAAAGGGAHPGC